MDEHGNLLNLVLTSSNRQLVFADKLNSNMDLTELEGLPLAEKKKRVMQHISEMESQMKQREQEQEMDDELRELLSWQDELKKKLSEGGEPAATASTSKTKTGKGKGKKSSKTVLPKFNQEIEVVDNSLAATLANSVNSTIPMLSQIKDMFHVSDKRSKVKKARRTSKKQRCSKKKYDTSDSDSSSSSYVDSSSSEHSSDEEDDHKRCK